RWSMAANINKNLTFHCGSHSKFFYLLNISELSILKNVTANDLETSYILFLSQLCNIQRTL
ncbi:site-specific integrase, partial [Bacteroides faecis]|nr:site-specific integrase [Bacteroides faecis]